MDEKSQKNSQVEFSAKKLKKIRLSRAKEKEKGSAE